MNMRNAMTVFLISALTTTVSFAGPIVNKLGKNPFNTQIAELIESALGRWSQSDSLNPAVAFYETFPARSMLPLDDVTFVPRSNDTDSVVLTDYIAIGAQSSVGSAIGLRMALAPQESRLKVSQSLAESGLVKSGDIIVSTRPLFANSLQYLALQLLNTHNSVAVVVNENGKKLFYNIDMPMDEDMLGGAALGFGRSTIDSPHFTKDNKNMMVHILRPRLDSNQKANLQKWLEKSLSKARAKTIYPKFVSFNKDYNKPTYQSNGDLSFVADVARLLLGQKMQVHKHIKMYCSEFSWVMLSLKDCNPDTTADDFKTSKTPACVKEFFKPMQMFGSAFSGGSASDPSLYGMSDGIPMLITQTGALPRTSMELIDFALPGVDREADGLSSGHKAIAAEMAPLIKKANGYFKLILTREYSQIDDARAKLNPAAPRNYSPTSFSVLAAIPDTLNGQKVTQKKFDYVTTIKYLPKAKLKDLQSK